MTGSFTIRRILFATLFSVGLFGAYWYGHAAGVEEAEFAADVQALTKVASAPSFEPSAIVPVPMSSSPSSGLQFLIPSPQNRARKAMTDRYWETWDHIRANYLYEAQVTDEKMFYGCLSGMVESLGDPYSAFYDPTQAQEKIDDMEGKFAGIGAVLDGRGERPVIKSVMPDSPAKRAGLKSGDRILAVDGQDTKGRPLEQNVEKIRGLKGTTVKLTVKRDGADKPVEIAVVRDEVRIQPVEMEIVTRGERRYAVVKLSMFTTGSAKDLAAAAKKIAADKRIAGVILDLRNDPGGLLGEAVDSAAVWVGKEASVRERNKEGRVIYYRSKNEAILKGIPTVVLTNGGTASASEIMAGALRDIVGTKIVGEKTYGKGIVQRMQMEPSDKSMLKLTVSEWLTPKGNSIHKVGIEPDVKVELTPEDVKADRDPQLDKAFEVLQQE